MKQYFSFRVARKIAATIHVGLALAIFPTSGFSAPNVVVSIAPLHSLVSAVMRGVAEPVLLVPAGQSPHAYSLKPSQIGGLSRAELIIWVGPDFELSLNKPLKQLPGIRRLALLADPAMHLLPARHAGVWETGHSHLQGSDTHQYGPGETEPVDPHIWLSAENAQTISKLVIEVLMQLDPENTELYQDNGTRLLARIDQTHRDLEKALAPVRDRPYLVFHDAYQYFEHEYELNALGAVTLNPQRKPGARTLLAITDRIEELGVRCIYREPQFAPRLVQRIAEASGIQVGELDPIGATKQAGPELWFELMNGLGESLLACRE